VNSWTEIGTSGATERFLRARLLDYGLDDYCEVLVSTSHEAAKGWNRRIDLLFIDGDHSLEGVRADFELFRPWMSPDGLVIFHDTSWNYYTAPAGAQSEELSRMLADMGVPQYMEILKSERYVSVTLPAPPGLTILDPRPGGFVFCPPDSTKETASAT